MYFLNSTLKTKIKNTINGTILEKPFYNFKLWYDLTVMNKWGKNYLYDQQTEKLISMLPPNSNCIDVGCHKGDILKAILESSPNGTHFAFEPIPELFDNLVLNFKTTKFYKLALSTQKGKTKFYNVVNGQGVSGLQKRNYDREFEIVEIDVEIDTLDNVIPDNVRIDFIKIDVEGGEFDVMRGGKKLIEKYKPIIIFEFEKEAASKYQTKAEDLYDFFSGLGMKLGLMEKWLNDNMKNGFSKKEFLNEIDTEKNFYFMAYK